MNYDKQINNKTDFNILICLFKQLLSLINLKKGNKLLNILKYVSYFCIFKGHILISKCPNLIVSLNKTSMKHRPFKMANVLLLGYYFIIS